MRLIALNLHPVKSTAVRSVPTSYVGPAGLRGDREWMVVDSAGDLVSARELPSLFRIRADTRATDSSVTGMLRLRADGAPDLCLRRPASAPVPVRVHRTALKAVPVGAESDDWLRAVTDRADLRLVWCEDPAQRRLNPSWGGPGDYTAFADSAPVTLVSTASLAQLNEWALADALERGDEPPEPLSVNRFRANLVIDGAPEPFAEDHWERVQIGGVAFRVAARVDRCVMTTIEPRTLAKGHDPIRTLARHRRWEGKTWFAVKLVPDGEGPIRVGDDVLPG